MHRKKKAKKQKPGNTETDHESFQNKIVEHHFNILLQIYNFKVYTEIFQLHDAHNIKQNILYLKGKKT